MPLISALGRQWLRQVVLFEFEASLIYKASSRTGSKAIEKPCFKKSKQKEIMLIREWGSLETEKITQPLRALPHKHEDQSSDHRAHITRQVSLSNACNPSTE